MNQPPQDLMGLKYVLKAATRKAVQAFVEATIECPPGLVAYLVAECWPTSAQVTQAIINEHEARQQQAEDQS